ncbi:hypothetical protein PWP93_36540 [Paraburkholderia sp. A1RI-2L]|uniref:hypothetical protein n=1 Tax=Paraburkholderia sp. A1RI-2L TaxID=3028367 RepID=UPI003B788370
MGQQVSFELFKSTRGIFLAFPFDCPVFEADTLVLSMQNRRLSAVKNGAPLDLTLPKLAPEVAVLLAGQSELAAVSLTLGGVTRSHSLVVSVEQ